MSIIGASAVSAGKDLCCCLNRPLGRVPSLPLYSLSLLEPMFGKMIIERNFFVTDTKWLYKVKGTRTTNIYIPELICV